MSNIFYLFGKAVHRREIIFRKFLTPPSGPLLPFVASRAYAGRVPADAEHGYPDTSAI
jgi:hypothetical protein